PRPISPASNRRVGSVYRSAMTTAASAAADRGKMLFYRRHSAGVLLDIRSNNDWLDEVEVRKSAGLAPRKKLADCFRVGETRVLVSNRGDKEFDKTLARIVT